MRASDVPKSDDTGHENGLALFARAPLPEHIPLPDLAGRRRGIEFPQAQDRGLNDRRDGGADDVVTVGSGVRVPAHPEVANLATLAANLRADHPSIASMRTSAYG